MILCLVLAATVGLDGAAAQVATLVDEAGFAAPVGVYVEGAPLPAARAAASLVIAQLAARKLAPVPVTARDADEAEGLARQRALNSLVRLTVTSNDTQVLLRGDALSTRVNFWSGSTATRSGPAVVVAAAAQIDEVTAALLRGPQEVSVKPLVFTMRSLVTTPSWPGAVALTETHAHALMGDAVCAVKLNGASALNCTPLSGTPASRPVREPFGILAPPAAWSARFDGPVPSISGVTVTPRAGYASFEPQLVWNGKNVKWSSPLSQLSASGEVLLGISPGGQAAISRGETPAHFVNAVGSGSALVDFDGDGRPEVLLTKASALRDNDEVKVVTLQEFERVQARDGDERELSVMWQQPLPGRAVVAASFKDAVLLGVWRADGTGALVLVRAER